MGHYDDFYEVEEERYRKSPAGIAAAKEKARMEALRKRIDKKYPGVLEYVTYMLTDYARR